MSRGHPATPAERTAMSRRMVRASELGDRHVGRIVKIGDVEGTLTGIVPRPNGGGVDLALLVGGARAWFALTPEAEVEHWRVIS